MEYSRLSHVKFVLTLGDSVSWTEWDTIQTLVVNRFVENLNIHLDASETPDK